VWIRAFSWKAITLRIPRPGILSAIAILQQPSGKLAANFGLFAPDWKCANDQADISFRQASRKLAYISNIEQFRTELQFFQA
jgi:hypothetical protein